MTPAARPNFPPRQPTPVAELSRPQIAARLATLRAAVDALSIQGF